MVDGLDGLWHDAVVGGDDQDRDVGGLRAAGAHGREGLVAGSVQEGDLAPAVVHLVGADVLGDAAHLALGYLALPDRVQEGCLAVVHVAQYGYDGRTLHQLLGVINEVEPGVASELLLCLRHGGHVVAKLACDQRGGIVVDGLVDVGEDVIAHQLFDDADGVQFHLVCELLYRESLGQLQVLWHNGLHSATVLACVGGAWTAPASSSTAVSLHCYSFAIRSDALCLPA